MTRLCINNENNSTENGNQPPGTRGNANYREDPLGGTTIYRLNSYKVRAA